LNIDYLVVAVSPLSFDEGFGVCANNEEEERDENEGFFSSMQNVWL